MDEKFLSDYLRVVMAQPIRHTVTFTLSVDHIVEVSKLVQKLQLEEMGNAKS